VTSIYLKQFFKVLFIQLYASCCLLTALQYIDKEMNRIPTRGSVFVCGRHKKRASAGKSAMAAIRKNPNLRTLFRINYIFGIWIPENLSDWGRGWKYKAWEILVPISALISLYQMMKLLISTLVDFRVTSLCQPVLTSLVYIPVLAKNAFLLIKKDSLVDLFKKMEDIVAFRPFKNRQEHIIATICKETRKTLLLLTFICAACYFITAIAFARFDSSIRAKLADNASSLLTEDERVTSEVIRVGTWTKDDYTALTINSIYAGVLPIKNIFMDSLMFLCHNFVIQELNLLQQTFNELDAKKIAFVNKSDVTIEHDQWINMFHKIRKLV
jgi:hypothetical protein